MRTKTLRLLVSCVIAAGLSLATSACKEKTPAEKAADEIKDVAEKTGDAIKEGAEKVGDAAKDAGKEIKKETEKLSK